MQLLGSRLTSINSGFVTERATGVHFACSLSSACGTLPAIQGGFDFAPDIRKAQAVQNVSILAGIEVLNEE